MKQLHRLAVPAYAVALLLVLVPLTDTVISTLPLRPGEVSWRFGATGLISRALLTPLVGVLIAFALAVLLEQHRLLRVMSVLTGILAVCVLAAVGLFVLDAVQMRSQVVPEARTSFDVASVVALAKYLVTLAVGLAFTVTGWRISGKERRSAQRAAGNAASDLIVRAHA